MKPSRADINQTGKRKRRPKNKAWYVTTCKGPMEEHEQKKLSRKEHWVPAYL